MSSISIIASELLILFVLNNNDVLIVLVMISVYFCTYRFSMTIMIQYELILYPNASKDLIIKTLADFHSLLSRKKSCHLRYKI